MPRYEADEDVLSLIIIFISFFLYRRTVISYFARDVSLAISADLFSDSHYCVLLISAIAEIFFFNHPHPPQAVPLLLLEKANTSGDGKDTSEDRAQSDVLRGIRFSVTYENAVVTNKHKKAETNVVSAF